MSHNSVFEFTTYKSVMKKHLRASGERGALSRAAEAMNCQRSYLSRVMNSKMQLTMDQAFTLCHHLRFSNEEREYFQTLVEHERASDRVYREHTALKIQSLKRKHEDLLKSANRPVVNHESDMIYFSSWHWSAIHFLTSISKFQTTKSLSQRLGLPETMVEDCLKQLALWNYVELKDGHWQYSQGEFHLPKQSPLASLNHQNWRNRAVVDSQSRAIDNIHYTNVQTASIEDIEKLKELALDFIRECSHLLGPSKPEDAVAINLDIFKI